MNQNELWQNQVKTKQDLLNQVQQQKVQLTNQNQKLQQQLEGASNPLQLEQFQKQQNILQHLNQQFQQQQVVLESEMQRQGEEKNLHDQSCVAGASDRGRGDSRLKFLPDFICSLGTHQKKNK